jgi:hypothetical protein
MFDFELNMMFISKSKHYFILLLHHSFFLYAQLYCILYRIIIHLQMAYVPFSEEVDHFETMIEEIEEIP